MGMYTEIIFGAGLKVDTPDIIITSIKSLLYGDEDLIQIDHPFFKSKRNWLLKSGGSYYFPGIVKPKFWYDNITDQWYLHFRTNIKNYDNEIEKFLDWIKPYIKDGVGTKNFYAIVTYEEDYKPTIYYLNEN